MRKARFKLPTRLFPVAYYHCISRIVDKRFIFKEEEKKAFVEFMRKYERFSGVRVVTFCVMENHFHILLEVTKRPKDEDLPSDSELVDRVLECQGRKVAEELSAQLADLTAKADAAGEAREILRDAAGHVLAVGYRGRYHTLRERFFCRMWDISPYMQSLKRRFSTWYNLRENRKGTLWEERFRSTVVQGGGALAAVAAYIDLNPVRAGVSDAPEDYAWSGYGEAKKGVIYSRKAIRRLVDGMQVRLATDAEALDWYAHSMECKTVSRAKKVSETSAAEETQECSEIAPLHQRVKEFTRGVAIGAKGYLQAILEAKRDYFGPNRKLAAQGLRHGKLGEVRSMRNPRP